MANTHILEQLRPGVWRVVYHFPIPATANAAGVQWRTCIVNAGLNVTTLPDGDGTAGTISAAEKAQVVSGAVLEVVATEKGQTLADLATVYTRRRNETTNDLQARFQQFGRTV